MMKAIVTGGTGFLGSHLVEMLADDGWIVIVLSRNARNPHTVSATSVEYRSVDITNLNGLDEVFEGVDVVFHCAALSSAWGSYSSFYSVNVEGTRNVLSCCEKYGVKKLIYVSSTSIYFNFTDQVDIKEDDLIAKPFANSYAETKYLGEQVVLNEKINVDIIIIRPRGIVGDGDVAIMPRILRVAKSGVFPSIRGGEAIVDITYVKNVAYSLLLCAKVQGLDKEIFNISNNQPMKVKVLLNLVFKNRPVKFLRIPYIFIFSLAWVLELISKMIDGEEPKLTVYGIGLLAYTQTLNIDKAKNILGYEPKYSIEEAVEKYLIWKEERAKAT